MKTPVRKPDGEMRPRIESWENVASHLRRFLGPRLGKKLAGEVTKHDIATLSNDIVAGKLGVKASVSNARHMRRAASGLFNWAAEAGRDYVTASPCVNLPKLDPEHARTRVLSEDEIRIFWHGLDRNDLPWDRKTRLALKFELVTMLRSSELLGAHRSELFDLDGEHPRFDVPAEAGQEAPRDPAAAFRSGGRDHPGSPDQRQAAIRLCQPARRSADEPQGDGEPRCAAPRSRAR